MTWGKVDSDTYLQTTESMQGDYSMVMPFLIKALLDNRARYEKMAQEEGEAAFTPASRRPAATCVLARDIASSSSARSCAAGSPKTSARIASGCWKVWRIRWQRAENRKPLPMVNDESRPLGSGCFLTHTYSKKPQRSRT